jgi:cytochrome c oxidase subunit II
MEHLIARASTYAKDVDDLIILITVLVGFWFLLAEIVFFWLILKFRAKDGVRGQYIDGSNPKHKRWVTIPHFLILGCDVVIIYFAISVWHRVKMTMPPADDTVRVYAQQWGWTFQHAGKDGQLDTADDILTGHDMHVEVNKNYHFELISRDVLHSFSIPLFRLKQDTIPGRVIKGWFNAEKTGEHDIQCAEMCGIGHGIMGARIHVETAEEHAAWIASSAPAVAAALPAAPAPSATPAAEPGSPEPAAAPAPAASPVHP